MSEGRQGSAATGATGDVETLRQARRRFERDYILDMLRRHDWSVREAARALGLPRPNLYRKARQLNIRLRPPETERES